VRKKKITKKEFEKAFWMLDEAKIIDRGISCVMDMYHLGLCATFRELCDGMDFRVFWKEMNFRSYLYASDYLDVSTLEESAMFRLMIAQEFIEQFNKGLK